MCIIDAHIILVCVVRSHQNYCIKYSTQDQHFAKMFAYSDNTNYSLNSYAFIVLSFIPVLDVSGDPDERVAC
jgi:hypothetical protein